MSKKLPIPTKRELEAKYNKYHRSLRNTAAEFGVSTPTLSRWLDFRSVERRRLYGLKDDSANWKGGIRITNGGRVKIWYKDKGHQRIDSCGYVLRYVLVWEETNGPLPDGWVIHHLNGIKNDDRIENLQAMPARNHSPYLQIKAVQKRVRELEVELEEYKSK